MGIRIRFTQLPGGSHRFWHPQIGVIDLAESRGRRYWSRPFEEMFSSPKRIDWNKGEHIETHQEWLAKTLPLIHYITEINRS
jgi:hypothetical protein